MDMTPGQNMLGWRAYEQPFARAPLGLTMRLLNQLLPGLSLLLAASLWGLFWWPVRQLAAQGLSGLWSTLIMYLAALLPFLPWFWRLRGGLGGHRLEALLLALFAGWCNIAFILALLEGNVVRVLLLFYLSPVWTVLLGWALLGERPRALSWLMLLVAMCGALIMLWSPELGSLMPRGLADLLALSSGMAFAVNNVLIRKTGEMPLVLKMVVTWIGVAVLAVAGILLLREPLPQTPLPVYVAAALFGWLVLVLMTFAAQYGVTQMPVHRSAVIMLFEIVVGALSAWWLAGEVLSVREWLGGGLVVLAAVIAAYADSRANRPCG